MLPSPTIPTPLLSSTFHYLTHSFPTFQPIYSSDHIFKTEHGVKTIVRNVEIPVTAVLSKCVEALGNVFEVIHPLSTLLKITFWGRLLGTFSSYTHTLNSTTPLPYHALAERGGRSVKITEKQRVLSDVQRVLWMIGRWFIVSIPLILCCCFIHTYIHTFITA